MKLAIKIIIWVIILLIGISAILYNKIFIPHTQHDFDSGVVIEIPEGSSSTRIGQILYEKGLIESPMIFRYTAKFTGTASSLRAGRHVIRRPMSIYELAEALSKTGGSYDIKVTIPEGWTIFQIAIIFENEMNIDSTEFYDVVFSQKLLDSLKLDVPSFEGFLFPDTYLFPETFTAHDVVLRMYSEFKKMWATKKEMAAEYGRPMEEIITLASIIESEATTASERTTISSVYNNRLRIGMMLQADPTTIYGLKLFHRPLTLKDLRTDNPYNTYFHKGLPPGPICNPSEGCIVAAMNPAETPYLYFVSKEDGTHKFSRTLKEHHQAIRDIRN
ncbi:MAG: endolytic transglycosylase MltG [Candidatus Zixiibacteriota bacterium]